MRRWSNDRFLSTPHGVINDIGTDRYSIAYFHSPNPTASSSACRAASGPTIRRAISRRVYRDLVLEFYRANYFHRSGYGKAAAPASP